MSLIAWYPLNGDTEDYSGNKRTAGNLGAVINGEGKIGKSYTFFNNVSGLIIPDFNLTGLEEYTMCAWVNPAGNHRNYNGVIISSGNWNGQAWTFGLSQDNSQIDVASNHYNQYIDYQVPLNTWTHILSVMKDNVATVYVNGVLVGTRSSTGLLSSDASNTCIGRETYSNGHFSFNGKLNDVRVYDHALSPKEIKEITKVKVLHYKFDDPYEEPTTNLLDPITAAWGVWGGKTGNSEYFTAPNGAKGVKVTVTNGEGGVNWFNSGGQKTVKPSTIYTVSGTMKFSATPSANLFYLRQYRSDGSQIDARGKYTASLVYTDNGEGWKTFYSTFTTAPDCVSLLIQGYEYYPREIYLHSVQLEEKDHATPFTVGTRQGIIRDCSGFRNDGISPTLAIKPESIIGSSYGEFNSSGQSTGTFSLTSETMTGSAWIKKTGDSTNWRTIFASNGNIHPLIISPSNEVSIFDGGQKRFSYTLSDTAWHHFVVIWKNGSADLYVDGVFNSTVATSYNVRTQPLRRIGNWDSGSYPAGSIADVQVYATALSASDIKELYELRGSIEPNGTFWVEDINEEDTGASLSSTGTAHYSTVNEVGSPIRYIRDFLNGSTSNTGNHWVEIKAIDLDGNNVALGKGIGTLTDGNIATDPYYSKGSGLQSVTIDLGSIHNVEYLQVWHYYYDKRTYHKTKTQVSSDGVNWVTLFDSGVEGEYQETSLGRKYLLTNDKVSISQSGDLFVSEITEI